MNNDKPKWYRLTDGMAERDLLKVWRQFTEFYAKKGLKLCATVQIVRANRKHPRYFIWREVTSADLGEKHLIQEGHNERLANIHQYLLTTSDANLWTGKGYPPPSVIGKKHERRWICKRVNVDALGNIHPESLEPEPEMEMRGATRQRRKND